MSVLLKGFLILLVLTAVVAVPYQMGKNDARLELTSAQAKIDKERADKISELTQENLELVQANQATTTRIANELAAKDTAHAKALADLRADLDGRLQLATTRQGIYQRQAQGSTAERNYLASHAAELDRSLEQGRSLVRELGETLRQRDSTIRSLSEQIIADRLLINE